VPTPHLEFGYPAVDIGLGHIVALYYRSFRFTPDSLIYSVLLFLKRHYDRTLGGHLRAARGWPHVGDARPQRGLWRAALHGRALAAAAGAAVAALLAIGTPRGTVLGPQEIVTTVNPYGKYALGPGNILGCPNRERRSRLCAAADYRAAPDAAARL
jgi:hypothetical protein